MLNLGEEDVNIKCELTFSLVNGETNLNELKLKYDVNGSIIPKKEKYS